VLDSPRTTAVFVDFDTSEKKCELALVEKSFPDADAAAAAADGDGDLTVFATSVYKQDRKACVRKRRVCADRFKFTFMLRLNAHAKIQTIANIKFSVISMSVCEV
jgi:hypothetical protein